MFREMARWGKDAGTLRRCKPATFRKPLSKSLAPGTKVFTCSYSDFFHEDADAWRAEAWDIIRTRPDLIFQILTKRPDRIADHLPADWGEGWGNVWLGTSVSAQSHPTEADTVDLDEFRRVLHLAEVPAQTRFLSIEPMLGSAAPALLRMSRGANKWLHWVIVGGESGSKKGKGLHQARKCEPAWLQATVDYCKAAGIPVFVKQLGSHFGRQHANIEVFPVGLRVQEWPIIVGSADTALSGVSAKQPYQPATQPTNTQKKP
jgi:protein gp37